MRKAGFRRTFLAWAKRRIHWLATHTSERNYQIIVAIAIGIVASLAAVVLKFAVFRLRMLIYGTDPSHWNIWFVFFPIAGILLCVFYIRYVLRKPLEIGAAGLIYAISRRRFRLPPYEMYAHVVSSSLTVGLGGSVGLEAPILRTGSAIGSNVAHALQAGPRRQTLFLACGVAAGMAAIFNSPVAGVIFALEVFLVGVPVSAFIPLLISSATGAVVARMLYYEELFYLPTTGWQSSSLPYYLLLGVGCGLLSVYMMRTVARVRKFFGNYRRQRQKTVIGGLLLGVMIFLFPPLFGEGYETINELLLGNFEAITAHSVFFEMTRDLRWVLVIAVIVMLLKSVAAAATLGMGGNGGMFAPAMFTGALFGFVMAEVVNLSGIEHLRTQDFIAVGMGGVLSGLMKAPLTGIFLIAEITGGYLLFVPLMIVSALSYFVSSWFEPQSIFTRELYQKGLWVPAHHKDRQILKNMTVGELLETDFSVLHPEDTLGNVVKVIAKCRRNLFPVVDGKHRLVGIFTLDDVRELMFRQDLYQTRRVKDIMYQPPAILPIDAPMDQVIDLFERHHVWNLPVVDEAGHYKGFLSKSSIFEKYRELLKEVTEVD